MTLEQWVEKNADRLKLPEPLQRELVRVPIGLELRIMRHMWEVAGYNAYRLYFNSSSFCAL